MRTGAFAYELQPRCRLADAAALLSDITRQGELHPLIIDVTERPPEEGALRSYAIRDQLKLGPFPFKIRYYADTLTVSETEIVTVARQRPRTKIRSRVNLTDEGDGTVRIRVEITLEAPSLLFGYALREGRAAHLKLAERMRAVLEAGGTPTG